jgi:hypothetical protein
MLGPFFSISIFLPLPISIHLSCLDLVQSRPIKVYKKSLRFKKFYMKHVPYVNSTKLFSDRQLKIFGIADAQQASLSDLSKKKKKWANP